ncbi:fluoride efflux transporter CrcB [Vampirovibrio chlorellavorus]|uniref:fluoride efflux transporter CrcB n=1 Tax=Vampirovibrio chlorellavorus TaxID=758823 RepID=UPI0026EDBCB4|nr:fluoride efflux transporter CrcB [Vampirovibrio chlorellavorus]
MNKAVLLIVGGSLGTLCRYYLADWGQSRWGVVFPFGTLLVNLLGCLLIGLLLGGFERRFEALAAVPVELRLMLMTGFLGAFTTFSSYELEAFVMLRQGAWERALIYLLGSLVLGLLLVLLGFRLGRAVPF